MSNVNWGAKWRSPHMGVILVVGCLLLVSSGIAYQLWFNRPMQKPITVAAAASTDETVSSLGRLEPEGEVIQVFAPTLLLQKVRELKRSEWVMVSRFAKGM